MKISNDTIDEFFEMIEKEYSNANLQRLLHRFSITGWENEMSSPKMIAKAIPFIQNRLNDSDDMGRFAQLVLTTVKEKKEKYNWSSDSGAQLVDTHPKLFNSLLRDGYKVENYKISKTAPEVIEDAKIPDELMTNLNILNLDTSKGHLEQAKDNYKLGNWAAANGMTRSFFESILIHINNTLNPTNTTQSGGDAIQKLSQSGFFKEDLNEIDKNNQPFGFIGGFWKMLHPHGSHPGLSVGEDSTFRFHTAIVTANYFLKRMIKET